MKDFFDLFDLIFLIIAITFSISFIIFCFFSFRQVSEENCVSFYNQNHYILDTCDKYSSKLETLDK
ncbi:MAG: hypothetical protein OSJ63_05310 [Bacilli bacterium]|nr:hypothetical protein [Bacilli bacterium]